VTTTKPDGTYKVGDEIPIVVRFSKAISLDGPLALLLETGPADRVVRSENRPQPNTETVEFLYKVQIGDRTLDLDYQSRSALFLMDSSVTASGGDVDLSLPNPGSSGSLSASANILIDGAGLDEQWQQPFASVKGLHGIVIFEDRRENVSFLASQSGGSSVYCSSVSESACSGKDLGFRAVLPTCGKAEDTNCISLVSAESSTLSTKNGKYDQAFPKRGSLDFESDVAGNLPQGATTSIYRFPDFPHTVLDGKTYDTYAVTASVTGSYRDGKVVSASGFFASITPVVIRETTCDERYNGQCLDSGKFDGSYKNASSGVAVDQDNGYRCILWDVVDGNGDKKIHTSDPTSGDKSYCAMKRAFPDGIRFTLQVRLTSEPVGWLHGRLAQPQIKFEVSGKSTVVTVAAGPVRVPAFSGVGSYEALPKPLQDYFDALCERNCKAARFPEPQPKDTPKWKRQLLLTPAYYSTEAFSEMALWRDFVADSASALPSNWNVRTLSGEEMGKASSCITSAKGVTGIVTTNATAYFEGPPSFDSKSKTLQYEVAAPHYEKDGKTEFKGVYNLIVREDVAECMYGFSNAFAAPAPPDEFADESDPDVYVEEEPYTDEDIYAEEYPEFEEEFVDTDDGSYEMFEDVEYEEVSLEDYVEEEEDFTLTEDVSDSGEVIEEEQVFEETVVASIDAQILTELQKAATANTAIELAGGWFKFSATNFTFSKPTVKVKFAATPSKVLACIAGSTVKYVKSIRSQCPTGTSIAKTAYCVKGKTVDAIVGASPKCPKGTKVAKTLKCAKGDDARLVVAVAPKCAKGWSKVSTYICVKGNIARSVSAVQVKCANGFELAKQVSCVKGRMLTTVTAVKPTCPKGYRVKKK